MHIDDNLFERVGAVILLVFDMKKSIKFYIFLIIALSSTLLALKLQYSVYHSSFSLQFYEIWWCKNKRLIEHLVGSVGRYYHDATFLGVEICLSSSSSLCTVSGFVRNSKKDLSCLIFCMSAITSSAVTPCFMSYSICLAQLEIVLYFLKFRF